MNAIATYQFSRPLARGRIELFEDSVRVTGSRNYADFDIAVPLARLDPHPDRVWVYGVMVYGGYSVLVAAVVLLMAFVTFVEVQDYRGPLAKPLAVVGVLGAFGMVLALWNRRKIEHVQFRSDAGVALFAIPRDGKKSGDFDRFVSLLIEQIGKARGGALSE